MYKTSNNGSFTGTGLKSGTYIVEELASDSGHVIDAAPQTAQIKAWQTVTLEFRNTPVGGVEIIKVVEGSEEKRIPNVTFDIRRMDDALVDTVTTGSDGRVFVTLEAGSYYVVETKCPSEFKLDSAPHYFEVVTGKTTPPLVVTNKAVSGVVIHKTDSVTGKGIYNVSVLVYDSGHNVIGQVTTDNLGFAYVEGLDKGGRYYLRELDNEGYIPDTQLKTVEVKAGESTLVEWKNTPIMGQIQITKKSANYNSRRTVFIMDGLYGRTL